MIAFQNFVAFFVGGYAHDSSATCGSELLIYGQLLVQWPVFLRCIALETTLLVSRRKQNVGSSAILVGGGRGRPTPTMNAVGLPGSMQGTRPKSRPWVTRDSILERSRVWLPPTRSLGWFQLRVTTNEVMGVANCLSRPQTEASLNLNPEFCPTHIKLASSRRGFLGYVYRAASRCISGGP